MQSTLLRLVISALAVLVFGEQVVLAQSVTSRGELLVSQHCAMCHAIGRSETSPNAMARPFHTLSRSYPIDSLEERLRNGALFGHPMMPGFVFSPQETNAIVRYLQSIQDQ
jgi:cytochrome c